MQPNPEVLDQLYREKVAAAKRMTPEERVLAAFELTDFVWRGILGGVRDQFPAANEEEVLRRGCERVALVKRLHERR
jgi:hypothetical protein